MCRVNERERERETERECVNECMCMRERKCVGVKERKQGCVNEGVGGKCL